MLLIVVVLIVGFFLVFTDAGRREALALALTG